MLQLLVALALLSAAITPTQEFVNPPPSDPQCISPWYPLWHPFENHPLCDVYEPNGRCEYYMCTIRVWSEWNQEFITTVKLVHTCAYTSSVSIPPPVEDKMIVIPLVIR